MDTSNEVINPTISNGHSIENNATLLTSEGDIFACDSLTMDTSYMHQDDNPKDITLIVNNKKLGAHKNVLASNSDYFDRMFNSSFKEQDQDTIELHITDVSFETLNTLIEYFYTSDLTITELNVQELLIGSIMFGVDNVPEACVDYIKDMINVENCITIKDMANSLDLVNLYSMCQTFIKKYFRFVANTQNFMNVNYDDILLLIKDDDLFVKEEMVYDVVIKWINHNPVIRSKYSPELLWHIRLPLILNTYQGTLQSYEFQHAGNSFRNEYRKPFRKGILTLSHGQLNSYVEWYAPGLDQWLNCMNKKIQTVLVPPTYLCTCFLLDDGRLFAFGGYENGQLSKSVYEFDLETKTWILQFEMCHARVKPYITQLEWKVFVVGGCISSSSAIEYYDIENIMSVKVAIEYSLEHPLNNMILSFNDTYITRVNELIYIIDPNNPGFFNTQNDSWSFIPQLPEKIEGAAICTLNNNIYIIGGRNNKNYYKSVWTYYTKEGAWMPVADMKSPRSFSGAAVMNGLIYVFGGKTDENSYSNTFEVYDPHDNEWVISNTHINRGQTLNDVIVNEWETSNTIINRDRIIIDAIVIENNFSLYKNLFENPNH